MSKTTPVRWWRDDATRYQGRPAYKGPEQEPGPTWAIELIASSATNLAECIARHRELMTQAIPAPLEILDPWGDRAIREGRSFADPAADIRSYIDAERLEIKRRSR